MFGLIPSATKIDSDWANLLKMRDRLNSIETSKELARYNELNSLIQSSDFQHQKDEIKSLAYNGSPECRNIQELDKLEKTRSIKSYFVVLQSPQLARFQKIAQSKELNRYEELKPIVESPDFQMRKKELESLRYKGSSECHKRQEFNSLNRNKKLNLYFKTIESSEFLEFKEFDSSEKKNHEFDESQKKNDPRMIQYLKFLKSGRYRNIKFIEDSGLATKLEQLKTEVHDKSFLERETFLKNVKRYETSNDYPDYKEYSQLSKNEDILFYHKYKISRGYVNYEKIKDSWELSRLKELRETTADPEFKKRVAYLKDKKRYESSDHYKKELEFSSLDKSQLMKEYRMLMKSPKLDFFNQWSVVFEEDFSENKLNTERWQPENYWGYKITGRSFSQAGEAQGYNGLNNVLLNNHILSILTKREEVAGQIWDAKNGLLPKQFEYSSGIINSAGCFRFREGVVEAKVKFKADASITNACSLTGSTPMPQVDVFRSGKGSVAFGITNQTEGGLSRRYKRIRGLNFDNFHVFRLEKFNDTYTWKINGYMVHADQFSHSSGDLFFNFISSLHEPVNNNMIPHRFEIDWIRCYEKKNN
jgi:hypothetical protein